jgi:hypothetical protein
MGLGEHFGRYWVAGLVFAIITGTVNTLTSITGNYSSGLRPEWFAGVVTGAVGILLFILVPWIYGRLIEVIYLKLIKD